MRKLKSDFKELGEGLSHFRYTNIIVLVIIFLAGFVVSASINQHRSITTYALTELEKGGGCGCGGVDCPCNQNPQNQNNNQNQNQPVANPTYQCLSGQPCNAPNSQDDQAGQNQQNINNNNVQNPQQQDNIQDNQNFQNQPNQNQQPVNNNQAPNQQNNLPVENNNNVQNPQPPQNTNGLVELIQRLIKMLQDLLSSLK